MKNYLRKAKFIFLMSLVVCLLLGMAPATVLAKTTEFSDVSANDWYYQAVEQISEAEIMNGISSTEFAPDGAMTRAMFVTSLARMSGAAFEGGQVDSPLLFDESQWTDAIGSGDSNKYIDVDVDSVYAPAIYWASENEIAGGFPDGTFKPEQTLTRAQAAVMTANMLKALGYLQGTAENAAILYTDGKNIASWAQTSVAMTSRLSVMKGMTSGDFAPNATLNRAQSAQLLVNLITFINKDQKDNEQAINICEKMTTDEKIGPVMLVNFRNWKTNGEEKASGMTELNSEVASVIKKISSLQHHPVWRKHRHNRSNSTLDNGFAGCSQRKRRHSAFDRNRPGGRHSNKTRTGNLPSGKYGFRCFK